MAAHSAPSTRRQLRTTALTSIATALAVVGLMFAGSALTTSTLGTTAGPVALLDAPAAPSPSSSAPPPVGVLPSTPVRKSDAPRTSTKPTPTTTTKSTRTTTAKPAE